MENKIIPYGRQNITDEDIQAVVKALKGDYLTQGPTILEFETLFSNYIGSKYAVAVSNGTAALHLAALALGVIKGSKVITTPITFAASANCVLYCGGEVIFSDIDSLTYLLDFERLEELLQSSPEGTYSGIIGVDFAGRALDMERLRAIANKYNCWIIEDACHAPGGYFIDSQGIKQFCGNSTYADLAVFSFHPVKHIATGEGGMITTNDEVLYKKLLELRSHGITREESKFTNSIEFASGVSNISNTEYPGWYMEMQQLGYNYRFTDFQAALGISQLKRAEDGLARRREIAKIYFEEFKNKPFILGQSGFEIGHAYHLYIIEVKDRLLLYNFLRSKNIFCQIHYIPCHLMPFYRELGWKKGDFEFAEKYYKNCISLPMYPSLTYEQQSFVINTILEYFKN